jgi:hypothetical protein
MENQTRFDLNAAIENWRNELAAQPNLAPDDRRELETHLRDSIAGFQQRGLNEEESFWLARRRVGQPQKLGEEFVKADPVKIWRERAFWIVLALTAFQLWNKVCPYLPGKFVFHHVVRKVVISSNFNPHLDHSWHPPFWVMHPIWGMAFQTFVYFLPVFFFITLFAKGRMNWIDRAFRFIFRSRLAFVLMSLAGILIFHSFDSSVGVYVIAPTSNLFFLFCIDALLTNIWPLALIVLIAWLMPTQNRKTPKRA